MSARSGRGTQAPPSSARQNEYFVPRDGIDREVITADICRYLGNDALVRPGVYESPSGQVIQGYFITAYRNLTTAMIEDLKADSARWDQERRQQTARNTAGVQYRNSDTHQSRQYYGPTESSSAPAYPDTSRDSYDASPRYPGTGSGGYTGASGAYSTAPSYGNQGGYGGQPGYGNAPQPQFSPSSTDAYPGGTSMPGPGFGQAATERPYTQPVHLSARTAPDSSMYGSGDSYPTGSRDRGLPASTIVQSRPNYVTAGPAAQQAFPAASSGSYYPQNQSSGQFAAVQPHDPFYGRAPASNPSFGAAHDQPYETTPPPRTSAPSSSTQAATSGSSSRRDNRDSVDRAQAESRQRHHRR